FHVTGVQTCALPISNKPALTNVRRERALATSVVDMATAFLNAGRKQQAANSVAAEVGRQPERGPLCAAICQHANWQLRRQCWQLALFCRTLARLLTKLPI